VLLTCQAGYEDVLAREIAGAGFRVSASGAGWVETGAEGAAESGPHAGDWCFAHLALPAPAVIEGASVNALATGIASHFMDTARDERFDVPWPMTVMCAPAPVGLGRRAGAVEAALRDQLQRRMSRVVRLATAAAPRGGTARGLFVFFTSFNRAVAARSACFGGQRRMADDPAAPSRSYLKVEEAYGILGREPGPDETVVDLGAAPGGWSYSAAERGARVIAVDNGPLKGGAAGHARIEHRREDAFGFRPGPGVACDWLFCDVVEEPHHVSRAIVARWLGGRWCRWFVVNLKFGRADVLELLDSVRRELAPLCDRLVIRHLFHDREEITLVGETRRAGAGTD
jgi:23S rRNA (cytidine2498-2'-O)-methyltransferase